LPEQSWLADHEFHFPFAFSPSSTGGFLCLLISLDFDHSAGLLPIAHGFNAAELFLFGF
jgi:hypothetical protein